MPRAHAGTRRVSAPRPIGVSAGTAGLVLAWLGGAAIARLTGATPVVIVLAALVVWFAGASLAGLAVVARARVTSVELPPLSTAGESVPITVDVQRAGSAPIWLEVSAGGDTVSHGWLIGDRYDGTAAFARRGAVDGVRVDLRSAGKPGLVWWRRRCHVPIEQHVVAPVAGGNGRRVVHSAFDSIGSHVGPAGSVSGETDGIRPWREGDSERSVHWSSSVRTGELIVHDRRRDAEHRIVVTALVGTPDPDAEAGAARAAIEAGLRSGARVWAAIGAGDPIPISDSASGARWSATADLGESPATVRARRWWRAPIEPSTTAPQDARWWCAAATGVSMTMLAQALDYSAAVTALLVVAVAAGALASARPLATGDPVSGRYRLLVGVGAMVAFVAVAARVTRLEGLLGVLRGPLPQVLMILIVLHGFECRDRRTSRVGLGVSGVVVMYAGGLMVDGDVLWWLLVWGGCFIVASARLSHPPGDRRVPPGSSSPAWWTPARRLLDAGVPVAAGLGATIVLLMVVPIPDGPARLTLPTLISDARDVSEPGAIAAPDGAVDDQPAGAASSRGLPGQAGGYVGFAEAMDTSARGALSDDVVMRVRAPAPAFWRGQTFARFDGRSWFADDDLGDLREGPMIGVPAAVGDLTERRTPDLVPVERFVQTFYAEADLPNVVFAAYRPVEIAIEADVWTRPDGANRASTVLPEGSVYTVVSAQPQVTAADLRRQGDVPSRLSGFGRALLAPYRDVPASTTDETIALADRLAEGRLSSYDVVLSYQDWLADNVSYDLESPVPDDGVDAVHDFLFNSRRGFCEQIASALTVMLRTQGIPARLATGYVAGERDQVAGVFEVRSSDAHAWVEVWFPSVGWQAFDPTASVPLSGDAELGTVGDDLARAASELVDAHRSELLAVIAVAVIAIGGVSVVAELRRRHRRGRWGLLQDRFGALSARRGAPAGSTNLRRAAVWSDDDDAAVAREIAETLDRVAFDPSFSTTADDDGTYASVRHRLDSLRHNGR
jgi:transglutaminase-like putative cysteine protease